MQIKMIEEEKDKIKFEVDDLTFANLLNEKIWEQKVDYSAYSQDHPYLSKPVVLVKAKNPTKTVLDAAQQIADEAAALRKSVK